MSRQIEARVADRWVRDLLGVLYRRRTVTRPELAEATGLNPANVSQTLRWLQRRGIIAPIGEMPSTGGRKREVVKLNSEAGFFAVADLEGVRIRCALVNYLGDIRYRWEEQVTSRRRFDPARLAGAVNNLIAQLSPAERTRVIAMGISKTGAMDREGLVTAVNLGWDRLPLRRELERHLSLPIFMAGSGLCKALAEGWYGDPDSPRDFIYVVAGVGIGTAMFVDGRFVEGVNGAAGEIGHLTVERDAPDRCNCGKRGCLEAIASDPNIVRQYRERTGASEEIVRAAADVFALAREKDAAAIAVVERSARALGLALSHVVGLLNPQRIVLAGHLAEGMDLFEPLLREELERNCLPQASKPLELAASALGYDSGLKGAAEVAFRRSLADPDLLRKMTGPVIRKAEPETARAGSR